MTQSGHRLNSSGAMGLTGTMWFPSPEGSMRRREFIAGLGVGLAVPLSARAQQSQRVWRIGSLSPGSSSSQNEPLIAFTKELNELGYVDGKNTRFERRMAEGALNRLPEFAAELVRAKVDVILAESSFAVEAARRATTT